MPKDMCCPYYVREKIKKNGERVGIYCKGGMINFPTAEARRRFVYPYCGSIKGFCDCQIYKFLEESGV